MSRARSLRLLLALVPATLLAAEPGIDARRSELESVRKDIERLQSSLDEAQTRRHDLQRDLRRSEEQIAGVVGRLRALSDTLGRQHARLERLAGERASHLDALASQRGALARQVRAGYATGRQERLKILLNQQDPAMVSRVMVYYDYLNRARAEQIGRIGELLGALTRVESEIAAETARLEHLHEQELGEQRALEAARRQRQVVLEYLAGEIEDQGDRLARLQEHERGLAELVERLAREARQRRQQVETDQRQPFGELRGRLPWPSGGRLVTRFGSPKEVGPLRWDGVLIAAPEGREVRAVHNGRVAYADWLRGFGLMLIVDHGEGYMTLYGHNQALFKEVGEWVEPGEPVALVGSSGGRANAGVYFGIRFQGKPVDPQQWCERPRGNRVGRAAGTVSNSDRSG